MYSTALGDIYTFGPTFRAENSNTARHLAEFWMIEPEIAFADLADDMACAEAYLKFCVKYILEKCAEDLAFFDSMVEKGLLQRLQVRVEERDVPEAPLELLIYTAIRALPRFCNAECGDARQLQVLLESCTFWCCSSTLLRPGECKEQKSYPKSQNIKP
jgi:aspartyl/asparaginyl-tRNA synthetase